MTYAKLSHRTRLTENVKLEKIFTASVPYKLLLQLDILQ